MRGAATSWLVAVLGMAKRSGIDLREGTGGREALEAFGESRRRLPADADFRGLID